MEWELTIIMICAINDFDDNNKTFKILYNISGVKCIK